MALECSNSPKMRHNATGCDFVRLNGAVHMGRIAGDALTNCDVEPGIHPQDPHRSNYATRGRIIWGAQNGEVRNEERTNLHDSPDAKGTQ